MHRHRPARAIALAYVIHEMVASSFSLDDCQVASNLETLHLHLVVPNNFSLVLPVIGIGLIDLLVLIV